MELAKFCVVDIPRLKILENMWNLCTGYIFILNDIRFIVYPRE